MGPESDVHYATDALIINPHALVVAINGAFEQSSLMVQTQEELGAQ